MNEETKNWIKIAKNDLKAAEVLCKEGLYLNVIEHSHAALEKLLKGIIVDQTYENPPRIHSLLKLVSLTLIKNMESEMNNLFKELDTKYLAVRYPEDIELLKRSLPKETVEGILHRVKEVFICLEKNIQN